MKKGHRESSGAGLRRRAQKRLGERKAGARGTDPDPRRLLHELEVHQLELEMQNEELRAARQEIEAGLRRYVELFDFAPIGYYVMGAGGTIREVNLAGARLLGMDRQWLVGGSFRRLVSEAQREAFDEFLRRVLEKGSVDQGSEAYDLAVAPDGSDPREVHLTAAVLAGTAPAVLVAARDVTERRRAEAMLREESRHKDDFLAALSHELRNPLAPIRNSLVVLERAEPGGEQARRAMAVIDRQLTHLTRIVDDLLDVTRIARGKIPLQRERVDLGDLARRTLDDHRPGFQESGIELEARLGSESLCADADATRLVQVLGNLLGNALKFTPRGGRVEVVLRRDGDGVALSVRDTGVGIAPELRERLFVPFRQGPQALDRTRGGLGLGLAMVKGLVELHGGTVDVGSDGAGRGATFTVRLPLAPGPATAAQPVEKRQTGRHRVLVVEDNLDAADSLREELELDGHDVQVAHDGPAALALARVFRPGVVICDIGLPGMNGYEVARALRADDALGKSYLIALSGYALPEDVLRAAEAGFDRHVAKPPSLETLERLIAEAPAAAVGTPSTDGQAGVPPQTS